MTTCAECGGEFDHTVSHHHFKRGDPRRSNPQAAVRLCLDCHDIWHNRFMCLLSCQLVREVLDEFHARCERGFTPLSWLQAELKRRGYFEKLADDDVTPSSLEPIDRAPGNPLIPLLIMYKPGDYWKKKET